MQKDRADSCPDNDDGNRDHACNEESPGLFKGGFICKFCAAIHAKIGFSAVFITAGRAIKPCFFNVVR